MITTLETYQKEPFRIPNAKPAPNGADKTGAIQDFIDRYERELLIDGLGVALYEEIKSNYTGDPLTLKPDAPTHIKDLIQGKTYELDGKQVNWEGLTPLLAYYVYWNFIQESVDLFSTFGVERPEGKNSEGVSAIPRATNAYREFFNKYQGIDSPYPKVVHTAFGVGLDYYGNASSRRSLFQYLQDNETTYSNVVFTIKENINSLGL